GAARSSVPQAEAQQFKAPYDIQIEQGLRVSDPSIAARPTRLLPQMKDPGHDLGRIDQAVIHVRHLARPESTGPIHFFQLTAKLRLAVGGVSGRKETVFKLAR